MPEVGDIWEPSKKEDQREKNRIKNEKRKEAKALQRTIPPQRVEAGKTLRRAFGGAFGRAPENIKFMASQGTTMKVEKEKESHGPHPQNQDGKIPEGETETDNE